MTIAFWVLSYFNLFMYNVDTIMYMQGAFLGIFLMIRHPKQNKLIGAYVLITSLIAMFNGLYYNVYMLLTIAFSVASTLNYIGKKCQLKNGLLTKKST